MTKREKVLVRKTRAMQKMLAKLNLGRKRKLS